MYSYQAPVHVHVQVLAYAHVHVFVATVVHCLLHVMYNVSSLAVQSSLCSGGGTARYTM